MLNDLQAAFAAHNWLLLVMLAAVYCRKLASPSSAFPITIPTNWRPTVTAAFGLVIAVVAALQAGKSGGEAALAGATVAASTGFLDGLLTAIFGKPADAPGWAKAIVFLFDDVAGSGQGQAPPAASAKAKSIPPLPLLFGLVFVLGCGLTTTQVQAIVTAEQDACEVGVLMTSVIPIGSDPQAVAADVKLACGIADSATPYVIQVIQAFIANQPTPPPAGAVYKPSPRVLGKRGAALAPSP